MEFINFFDEKDVKTSKHGDITRMVVTDATELLRNSDGLIPLVYRLGQPRNITDFLIEAIENTSDEFTADFNVNVVFSASPECVAFFCVVNIVLEYENDDGEEQCGHLVGRFKDIPLSNKEKAYIERIAALAVAKNQQ